MGAPELIVPGTASGTAPVGGSGTSSPSTIPRWTGPSTLGDSVITQSGTLLGVNKAVPTSTFDIDGLQANTGATSVSSPTGTLRLNFAGAPNAGDFGASAVFSQQWAAGSPTSYVAVGQIAGVKTAGSGSYGGGLAFFYGPFGISQLREGFRLDQAGNVGIGTASPAARTHIKAANAAFRGQLTVEGDGTLAQITLYNGGTTSTDLVGQIYTDSAGSPNFHISAYKNTGALYFETGTSNTLRWSINSSGHFLAGADNTYDIGASGATRPRTVYAGTSVIIGPSATAAGTNANAIGQSCSAGGINAFAAGSNSAAYQFGSIALGRYAGANGVDSVAIGGSVLTNAQGSFAHGLSSNAQLYGQDAHAAGVFANAGDAQVSTLVARVTTTDAVATNVWLNGTNARLLIPTNTTWAANIHVTCRKADGATYAYYIRQCVIQNNAGTTALAGAVQTIGTDIESNAGLDVAVTADNTNDALDIKVTGLAGETLRWVVRVELVEIGFAP